MFHLSIIIPTYNGKQKITNLLTELRKQSIQSFELIVVIDGSVDGTADAIKNEEAHFEHLKIINQANKGRAGSRNTGAKIAATNILLFIDDDMVPSPTLVADHLGAQATHDIVVGTLAAINEDANEEIMAFSRYKNEQMNAEIFAESNDKSTIPYITANNFSIKKDLFIAVGAFDERLNDAEDFELAVRLVDKNYKIFYSKNCLAYHTIFKTLEESANRSKEYRKGREALLRIHPNLAKYPVNSLSEIKIWKRPLFYLFSFKFWLKLADKNFFTFLPTKVRFKLYDIMWVGNYYF